MGNLSVTITALFFLLTVSLARIPSNLPEDEVIPRQLPHSPDDSEVSSVLRLPSDSVNDESRSTESAGDIPESVPMSVKSIPLRFVQFRPINRHFPIRSRFPFHNCRHHHHRHDRPFFKPIRQQQQQEHAEIPYGNDVIISTDEKSGFDPLMFHHGRMRRIPARWVKFHVHNHDHDHHDDDDEDGFSKSILKHARRFGKEKFKKRLHYDEDDRWDEENEEIKKKQEGKREEEGGFLNRVRKFLDHSSLF